MTFVQVDISDFGWEYTHLRGMNLTADQFTALRIHKNEFPNRNRAIGYFDFSKYAKVFVLEDTARLSDFDIQFIPEDLHDIVKRKYHFFTLFDGEIQLPSKDTPQELWDYVRQHPEVLIYRPPTNLNGPAAYLKDLCECEVVTKAIQDRRLANNE